MRWGGPDEVTLKPPERAAAKRSGPEPDAAGPERDSGATLVADAPAESSTEARTEAPAPRRSPENDPGEAAPDVERSPSAADPGLGQRSETTREVGTPEGRPSPSENRRRLLWGRRPSPGSSRDDAAAPTASPS